MKISKILIQTDRLNPPDYLIKMNTRFNEDWKYEFYSDEDALKFIIDNPIEEFSEAPMVFKDLEKGAHKSDFFRYYYLYLKGGVYIDSDFVLKTNLNDVVKDYEFFCVKSMINNESMFNGFIGCEPKNEIIYRALNNLYFINRKILNTSDYYFYNCKNLNTIIENYKSLLISMGSSFGKSKEEMNEIINTKIKIYNEQLIKINNNSARIYRTIDTLSICKEPSEIAYTEIINDNYDVLGIHYFAKDIIKPDFIIPDRELKEVSETKIGLTLDLPNRLNDLFCNGIRQNVLYLGELLLNIGYDVYFTCNKPFTDELINNLSYDSRFKFIPNNKILSIDFDVMISIGYELEMNIIQMLKYMKTKIVSYNCGNNYIIDSESMLYSQHETKNNKINYIRKNGIIPFDIIWSIPQMTNTNQYYWSTLMRTKCIEVPFIWSENSIKIACKSENRSYSDLLYINRGNEKRLVIFEPNISIMKWSGPALLSCENAYRTLNDNNKNKIKHVFLNNLYDKDKNKSINIFNMNAFTSFVNNLDLCSDRKISIESRFNTLSYMSTFADVAVSHQWENNLNYLYFDLAWMGWPIIHNASLCKDVGYYYDQFNYEEGGKRIIESIENHDNNVNEYIIRNRQAIDKYLTTNKELQEKYKILISGLFINQLEQVETPENKKIKSEDDVIMKTSLTEKQLENIQLIN
jgi:hypothetical protein